MLPEVGNLFKRALAPYHKFPKFMTGFLALMFLPVLFIGMTKFSLDLIGLVYGVVSLNSMLWVVGSVLMSLVSLWFTLAYMIAFADIDSGKMPEKIQVYLKKTRSLIVPAFGLTILVGLIVLGGFILLIIPGIIFSVWFVFTLQARVLDQKKGTNALSASKSLVAGNWWGVFGRIVLATIIVTVCMRIFESILNGLFPGDLDLLTFQKLTVLSFIVTVLTAAAQAIFTPFASAIPTIMYLDLKKGKPVESDPLAPPLK
ncbi:MAG TPA: hypothetical protein PK295_02905 [Candidatus Magasanikbacteria bacterium]|nr:hypothetical protein [Candidatus Magasanikbacteria bacterium]